ncbi:hypothetical protein [Phycicoccus sonneratiae]|uniref:Uncharacterized protein n=1 Tax=Phycicoccus sonneratiae TaxID=2807628 RepID=A0ABS2CP53_9MICO|nr:hypothetical protein [Phycicoccus sonneraticus]MBM6401657.1 hypothetical protein [Phycicoccus sonneraticus]
MSFFERAKAAASDLAAKADVAMSNAGVNVPGMGGDRALRDLGVIAWMDATGRPVADADRERVMATLRDLESSGRLGPLTLTPPQPAYGAPPPPPGAAGAPAAPAAPPPPPAPEAAPSAPPPPPSAPPQSAPPPPAAPPAAEPPRGDTPPPPPPPPSWA